MRRGHLRHLHRGGRQPSAAAGEERRILHALALALKGRIDHRGVAVGVGAEPLAVEAQRGFHDGEVALLLRPPLRPQQQPHLHGGQCRVLERARQIDGVWAGGPGEIVNILGVEAMGGGAVAVVFAGRRGARRRGRRRRIGGAAGRAHYEADGHGDGHVVDAVVGEELGGGMELVRVPALSSQHAQLGEPLGDEVVVADVAGARDRLRHLAVHSTFTSTVPSGATGDPAARAARCGRPCYRRRAQ